MANDVLTLMELDLMTDRCDLVGHSMGGRTAMALAMSHVGQQRIFFIHGCFV